MTPKDIAERELLDKAFDDLFPIMRSITGPGIEESLNYFKQFMPLEVSKIPTGTRVFDWTVPPEWHFQRAQLYGPEGELICDTNDHTLHVVNYSEPIEANLTLEELQPHLHSLPDLPDAIPYVTSYYKRTWGFCLKHSIRATLKPGRYKVKIEASFKRGGVPFATCTLPGESEKEILLTSYLCHPSLANNELSGPLTLLALYRRISQWENRKHTFRFLLNPETIGSLCFLHQYSDHLKHNLDAGLILTCVGGTADNLRYKSSRRNSPLDLLMKRFADGKEQATLPIRVENFSPLDGSDERQYCAPGFNLPVGQIARSVYGSKEYVGYHNSLDDKEFMNVDSLISTTEALEEVLKLLDICINPVNLEPYGEPQLGKRGLYPNINAQTTRHLSGDNLVDGRTQLNRLLTVLSMSDGHTNVMEIADQADCSLSDLIQTFRLLEKEKLISFKAEPLNK